MQWSYMQSILKFLVFALLTISCAYAQNLNDNLGSVKSNIESQPTFLPIEEAFTVSIARSSTQLYVVWNSQPTYYIYQRSLEYHIADQPQPINYVTQPIEKFDLEFDETLKVFFGQLETTIPISNATKGTIALSFQGCTEKGLCYIPTTWYFDLNNLNTNSSGESSAFEANQPFSLTTFFIMALLAFLGGIVLNVMPCVFPILSIKAIEFLDAKQPKAMGWNYSAGVIVSMLVLASILLMLRNIGGSNNGWGFQMQYPQVTVLLYTLFFAMACMLLDLYHFTTRFQNIGNTKQLSSFGTGMLAVIIASPCTAPFMASALGFAFTQPSYVAIIIFIFLGFGLAFPILLLSHFPNLKNKLPKAGGWMNDFKNFMALPLFLTCIWLLWVLYYQLQFESVLLIIIASLFAIFGFIMLQKRYFKMGALTLLVAVVMVFFVAVSKQPSKQQNDNFTLEYFDELAAKQQPFFINVTAKWCITCKVNEQVVFNTDAFQEVLQNYGIDYIVLDVTTPDSEVERLLKSFQHPGVPLYLWKPKNTDEVTALPQLLNLADTINLIKTTSAPQLW